MTRQERKDKASKLIGKYARLYKECKRALHQSAIEHVHDYPMLWDWTSEYYRKLTLARLIYARAK